MATAQDEDDTWVQQPQTGKGAWTGRASGPRAAWYAVGLAGSLLLLGAFYLVLHQALARAEQHWAGAVRAEPCPGRSTSAAESCARPAVTTRSSAASPR